MYQGSLVSDLIHQSLQCPQTKLPKIILMIPRADHVVHWRLCLFREPVMFLEQARAVTKSVQPITFHSYLIQSIPTGIQSFSFLMDNPRLLQAVSYKRSGGHTFDFTVKVLGRLNANSPWTTLIESPLTPNPITPEVDILIPEELQAVYTEYLMLTESMAAESRIAQLTIGFKQVNFLEE